MKAFGLKRVETAARMKPGTSRPCPCCTYVRAGDVPFERAAKKRERASARAEISSDLLDMELDAAGVESAWEPFRNRDYRAPEGPFDFFVIAEESYQAYLKHGADRCSWCGCYEGCDCDRDYYDDWRYEYGKCWNCNYYKDSCNCGWYDCTEAGWVALWVDGKVDAPEDYSDYRDYRDEYDWDLDYDFDSFYYPAEPVTPDVGGTELLVAARKAEKLKAGNRYYLQNRRAA